MNKDYMSQKGRIFDIQRYSVHDGPGIRTLIFLKGCLFRCKWCCNPESQNFENEVMKFDGKDKQIGREMTVEALLMEIEKDRKYYERSGGGITLSGGECLCQPEFVKALLYECRERGISTAIETTAGVEQEIIKEILEVTDLVMMDIKHMDTQKHLEYTGRENKQILANAKYIAESGIELIIRIPIITNINDTKEEIGEITSFVKGLKTVKVIHLLPYHRMGIDKYSGLNRVYELAHLEVPNSEKMQHLLEVVRSYGMEGQMGG